MFDYRVFLCYVHLEELLFHLRFLKPTKKMCFFAQITQNQAFNNNTPLFDKLYHIFPFQSMFSRFFLPLLCRKKSKYLGHILHFLLFFDRIKSILFFCAQNFLTHRQSGYTDSLLMYKIFFRGFKVYHNFIDKASQYFIGNTREGILFMNHSRHACQMCRMATT